MVDGAPFGRPTGSLVVGLPPDGRCPSGPRSPGRDGCTVMLCPSRRETYSYNILQKYFCSINYVQRIPLLDHTWPCFKIFCMVRIYSCLIQIGRASCRERVSVSVFD